MPVRKLKVYLFCFLMVGCCICFAQNGLDKSRYIDVDEVKPGMKAYCFTCYKGTEIEKFELEVLDVVHNIRPGRDAILVKGIDPRFVHTGPVAGCSGSPVFIDGRMAGALAFGWFFSKDALYGITPISEMLQVGLRKGNHSEQSGFVFDYSRPIEFADIEKQVAEFLRRKEEFRSKSNILPCPLVTSLPAQVCEDLDEMVRPLGLIAVPGAGAGGSGDKDEKVKLEPGSVLTVPVVTGDITMAVVGTVTEVVEDKVYGFGHSFLGYGPVDLPIATGKIHTVVANLLRSFKLGTALERVGALKADEAAAVYGQIGAKARMIPLTIKVSRYNDPQDRVYNCEIANNKVMTPTVLRSVIGGAVLIAGDLPPNNTIKYSGKIELEGFEPISFENVSTSLRLDELLTEAMGSVALFMNNPYKKVAIKSMDFNVEVLHKNIASHIWSANLQDSEVKAGEEVNVSVLLESFLAGKKEYEFTFEIPRDLKAGDYKLVISGASGYIKFLRQSRPYKFVPENMATLVEAVRDVLNIPRDKLYCYLVLPSGGLVIERGQLPDLPATKALVLQDNKKTLKVVPYRKWIENNISTGTIVLDQKTLKVKVKD
ncbi:MAG: SpoIVB peptidase S55 domain-containing protein [Planctomycetota bacterium]|jgi:hypothetical protein